MASRFSVVSTRADDGRGESQREGRLSADDLQEIVFEIQEQPEFRDVQDRCADYYDGNQLDQAHLDELQRRGLSDIIDNLIQPTVDVVLGTEAKMRRDTTVSADLDIYKEVAEALAWKLHEAERETRFDDACSNAYKQMIITGCGWTEVSRQTNPFKYPYRVCGVHRRELFWDWTAKEPDLSDARYMVRQRWFPADQIKKFYPKHGSLIDASSSGWGEDLLLRLHHESAELVRAYEQEQRISFYDWQWRDVYTKQVALYEVYWQEYVSGYVFRKPMTGKAIEFNTRNPYHRTLVEQRQVEVEKAVYTKLYRSVWLGPHMLEESPVETLPYVPWWCYREDLTGVPYGLVRGMLPAQDEINARAQKLAWALSARRLTVDSDALDTRFNTLQDVLDELARADAAIVTDPNRRNPNAIRVDDNFGMADQQMAVLQNRTETLQKIRGIYNVMMGDDSGAKSGIAINSLVEQSLTVLAEPNANAEYSRRLTAEKLLDLIQEDYSGHPVQVVVGDAKRKKVIVLNKPIEDEQGNVVAVENDVEASDVSVALNDVPQTSAYRAQQLQMLTEVVRSLPPDMQMTLAPYYLEATDLPDREEMASLLRQRLQLPSSEEINSEQTPEQVQQQQAEMARQQEMQRKSEDLLMAEQEAKTQMAMAQARKAMMEAGMMDGGQGGEVSPEMAQYHEQMESTIQQLQQQIEAMQQQSAQKEMEIMGKIEQERVKADAQIQQEMIRAENQKELAMMNARMEGMQAAMMQQGGPGTVVHAADRLDKTLNDAVESRLEDYKNVVLSKSQEMERSLAEISAQLAKIVDENARMSAEELRRVRDEQRAIAEMVGSDVNSLEMSLRAPKQTRILTDKDGLPIGSVSVVHMPDGSTVTKRMEIEYRDGVPVGVKESIEE